jgi:hypothetical protein
MLELVLIATVVFVVVMIAKAFVFVLKPLLKLAALCVIILILIALTRMLGLC